MSSTLSPETEELLRSRLRDGQYAWVDDLIRDALQALDERNGRLAAIAEDLRDAGAGRTRPVPEVQLTAQAKQRIAEGQDPLIGIFAEDAEILDQIEADIMRDRERFPRRTSDGGETAE
jgi:Arc/MetJ-type ribon-helix-helix transcriptional regulator